MVLVSHIRRFSQNIYRGTIFALSSGFGKCGVAVIRVSGPHVRSTIMSLTGRSRLPRPRQATLANLYNPTNRDHLDKALVLWFPGPNSFTGEDTCEYHVHGGPAVIQAIHAALGKLQGLRPAETGEFTKRAFLNGKLDLTEVEGLGDLIHAETEAQRKQALRQMKGDLSRLYQMWTDKLLKCVAHIEAFIDFSEEENIEDDILEKARIQVGHIHAEICHHLADKRCGERLRDGVHVTILGHPNVGKSSLLNDICQRPAAIVSPTAGTTRDVIETTVNIGGYPVILSDTAGVRHSEDSVEIEGIKRAKESAHEADVVILMTDALEAAQHSVSTLSFRTYLSNVSTSLNPEASSLDYMIVINKSDVVPVESSYKLKHLIQELNGSEKQRHDNDDYMHCCLISCKTGEGIEDLLSILAKKVEHMCINPQSHSPSLTQQRHRHHLEQATAALEDFFHQSDVVLAAVYLRISLRQLGKITGKVGAEDILDVVFKDFCIGK
ncbi:tRNA modification GTPase GTPBP3, mitochondrial-like [Anneissia japonica]|uniref:tRNA modification GTPase GTPBP3, mitochondrial-like n=1 Tax=Anneissia japonica TaxID=1529436 RepID=UPI001425AE02|nr:tRNA modification GTPase GTPBP3, mitochondrial-like [Anneissia japonica]